MDAFYGQHLDCFNSVQLCFTLAAYATYRKWREGRGRSWLALSLAAFLVASLTEWTGFYIVLMVFIEDLVRWRTTGGSPRGAGSIPSTPLSPPGVAHSAGGGAVDRSGVSGVIVAGR